MFFLPFILLLSLCSMALADHKTEPNQVYNPSSQLTVENLNKATEILRDPTKMSGNFRQALKKLKPSTPANENSDGPKVPDIKLLGKIYVPKTLNNLAIPSSKVSSVSLSIDKQTIYLKEGAMSSVIKKEHLITVHVEEITQHYVKLTIQPNNETLILH